MIRFIKKIFPRLQVFANAAEGTHAGSMTRQLEAAVSTRYLLGKQGSATNEVALCDSDDSPLGVIVDSGAVGENVSISLLGSADATALMVASEAITAGSEVFTAANGKVQNLPWVAGTYYQVGRALTAAVGDNSLLEVEPTLPRKLVVMAPFTGNTADDVVAVFTALQAAPDRMSAIPSA